MYLGIKVNSEKKIRAGLYQLRQMQKAIQCHWDDFEIYFRSKTVVAVSALQFKKELARCRFNGCFGRKKRETVGQLSAPRFL